MAPRISRVDDIETRFGAKTDFDNLSKIFDFIAAESMPEEREECFKEAWTAYAAPERKYHNTGHIGALYRDLAPVLDGAPPAHDFKTRAAWLAVIYHDVVYQGNTGGLDEAMSAAHMRKHAVRLKLPMLLVDAAVHLIATTAHHFERPSDLSREGHLFLDADLAGLASETKLYFRQEQAIRQEYKHVPDEVWAQNRVKFCHRALAAHRIFHTRYFGVEREWLARTNLLASIKRYAT